MSEKQLTGKMTSASITKTGKNEKGVEWTLYKYKIQTVEGERTASGFIEPDEYLSNDVVVHYTEKDNPDPKKPAYKNVVRMEVMKEIAEANKKYGVTDTGDTGPFFGMIFNQSCNFINSDDEKNYADHFEIVFEKLWGLAKKKRKEKLGF